MKRFLNNFILDDPWLHITIFILIFILNNLVTILINRSFNILAIQEPHVNNQNNIDILPNNNQYELIYNNLNRPKSALLIKRKFGRVIKIDQYTNDWTTTIAVKIDQSVKLIISSIYFNLVNTNVSIRNQQEDLDIVQNLLNEFGRDKIIILTDSNEKYYEWEAKQNSQRGKLLS